jgi:hypothetical protein
VQHAAAGGPDALVDRVADDRVVALVVDLPAAFLLGDGPPGQQCRQRARQVLQGAVGGPDELAELHRAAEHGEQLERGAVGVAEAADPAGDPLGEALGQPLQPRRGEVGALLQQRAQQADREQGVAPRPGREPVHQLRGRGPLDQRLGQLHGPWPLQRDQLDPGQRIVLLQLEQHPSRDVVVRQLRLPSGGDDQERQFREPSRGVAQDVPGGGVGEVDVVEDGDHRPGPCEAVEDPRQALQQALARRLSAASPRSRGPADRPSGPGLGGRFGGGIGRQGVRVGHLGRGADERPAIVPAGPAAAAGAGQLLVLDNFEDVVDAAPLLAELRRSLLTWCCC